MLPTGVKGIKVCLYIWFLIFVASSFGILGAIDDFLKIRNSNSIYVSKNNKKFAWALGIENIYYQYQNEEGNTKYKSLDAGENAPTGLVIKYYLPKSPEKYNTVKITIKNKDGEIIDELILPSICKWLIFVEDVVEISSIPCPCLPPSSA